MALQFTQASQPTKRAPRRQSVSVQAYCGPYSRRYRKMGGSFRPSSFGWSTTVDEKVVSDFINSFFEELGGGQPSQSDKQETRWFPVFGQKTDTSYELKVECPGVQKDDVDIKVNKKRQVKIAFERMVAETEDTEVEDAPASEPSFYEKSRRGKFLRVLKLPEDANIEGMKASVENGVLTVTIPRNLDETERFVDVEVQ